MTFIKIGTYIRFLRTFDKNSLVINLFSKRNLTTIDNEKIYKNAHILLQFCTESSLICKTVMVYSSWTCPTRVHLLK